MFRETIFFNRLRPAFFAFAWCLAAVPTAHAADPAPAVPPSANPSLANPSPELRTPAATDLASSAPPSVAHDSATAPAPSTGEASAPQTPSQNVTINLINLMVKRGLITKEDAADLIKQAQQEADVARAQAAAAEAAAQKVDLVAEEAQRAAQATVAAAPPPASDDEVRVPYVPEVVKNQIRDEVTRDVMQQTHDEELASPDTTPDWVRRFRVTGDIRTRFQDNTFPSGNATGQNFNFNAMDSATSPILVANGLNGNFPTYNVDQTREQFRLRARIGAEIDLGENFSAGMRIGTGADNQPVSENQTLGGVNNGQGSDFSKYQLWLDRGFIRYELGDPSDKYFSVSVGRFDNPFMSTSMIWADDIGFDGAAIQAKYKVADGVTPFLTGGAFPVFNTDLNFGTNSTTSGQAYQSYDKWLYAGQLGTNWKINQDFTFKGAIAFYDFENIQGQVSAPITATSAGGLGGATNITSSFAGPTDDSRPEFAQKGNTYIPLRDYVLDNASDQVYQYFGLATPFRETAIDARLDFSRFDPFHLWLIAEYVKNIAFDKAAIEQNGPGYLAPGPVNNIGPGGNFQGGDTGYDIRFNLGKPSLEKLWDWNVSLTYRYLESDAVVDGFNDSDFGGGGVGGTNVKGYIIGGNLALSKRVSTGLQWMSMDSIAGPQFNEDLFQFDLNAKF